MMLDKGQLGFKFPKELKDGLTGCFGSWRTAILAESEWSETVTINSFCISFLKKFSYTHWLNIGKMEDSNRYYHMSSL
jgi:hypothetical protein